MITLESKLPLRLSDWSLYHNYDGGGGSVPNNRSTNQVTQSFVTSLFRRKPMLFLLKLHRPHGMAAHPKAGLLLGHRPFGSKASPCSSWCHWSQRINGADYRGEEHTGIMWSHSMGIEMKEDDIWACTALLTKGVYSREETILPVDCRCPLIQYSGWLWPWIR